MFILSFYLCFVAVPSIIQIGNNVIPRQDKATIPFNETLKMMPATETQI